MRQLGGYTLHAPIGTGAAGRVWRAQSIASGAAVAVKVLHEDLSDDPDVRRRFLAEAALFSGRHLPHVVHVHEVVEDGDRLGLVLDLVDGPDLRAVLRTDGRLAPGLACALVSQVAVGLAGTHAAGVVHRDLKPENVLVLPEASGWTAYVTDFGIARSLDAATTTRRSRLLGTPDYTAPEVVAGAPAGPAADVYAAGVLLFEALAGHRPFRGEHPAAVLEQQRSAHPERPDGLPDDVWAVVRACLQEDPHDRPSAQQLAVELGRLAVQLPSDGTATRSSSDASMVTLVRSRPPRPDLPHRLLAERGRRALGRRQLAAAGAALVLLGVAGATAAGWRGPGSLEPAADRPAAASADVDAGPGGRASSTPSAGGAADGAAAEQRSPAPGPGAEGTAAPDHSPAPEPPSATRPDVSSPPSTDAPAGAASRPPDSAAVDGADQDAAAEAERRAAEQRAAEARAAEQGAAQQLTACYRTAVSGSLELQAGGATAGGPNFTSSACTGIHIMLTGATYQTWARSCLETPDGSRITSCSDWVYLSYPDTWDALSQSVPARSRWQLQMKSDGTHTVRFSYTA